MNENKKISKNLMCVPGNMEAKVAQLEEAVSLSNQILDKLNNPRKLPMPEKTKVNDKHEQNPMGLLDLIYKALDRIDRTTIKIQINLREIEKIIG